MLHVLHVEMVLLVRDVLSKFLKPDAIPLDVKGLINLDIQNKDSICRIQINCCRLVNSAILQSTRPEWRRNLR